jgi:hypothetical protein
LASTSTTIAMIASDDRLDQTPSLAFAMPMQEQCRTASNRPEISTWFGMFELHSRSL